MTSTVGDLAAALRYRVCREVPSLWEEEAQRISVGLRWGLFSLCVPLCSHCVYPGPVSGPAVCPDTYPLSDHSSWGVTTWSATTGYLHHMQTEHPLLLPILLEMYPPTPPLTCVQ
jgi:hypothetical protein